MTPERVKVIRITLGYTVEEFADRCGVTPRTIYRWEEKGISDGGNIKLVTLINNLDTYINRLKEDGAHP